MAEVFELEPEQSYNVTGTILVGAKKISIKLNALAPSGERAMIVVDSDEPFASVGRGGSLTLSGIGIACSEASQARRRRRLAAGGTTVALVNNNGGTLYIVGSELRAEADSLVVASTGASGELIISSSSISGRVYADKGKVP